MNVEIGAEAALFPEKEYVNGIAVAVCGVSRPQCTGLQEISQEISFLCLIFRKGQVQQQHHRK
jgi:hypothetical protein